MVDSSNYGHEGPIEADVSIVDDEGSSFSTEEMQSNPVANALARLEGVIKLLCCLRAISYR